MNIARNKTKIIAAVAMTAAMALAGCSANTGIGADDIPADPPVHQTAPADPDAPSNPAIAGPGDIGLPPAYNEFAPKWPANADEAVGITPAPEDLAGPFPVKRVIDGGLLVLDTADGEVRVRLGGVDTKASTGTLRCQGMTPQQSLTRLAEPWVWVGTEALAPSHGVTVAHLWTTKGDQDAPGHLIALEMLDKGLLMVRPGEMHSYVDQFANAQTGAQQAGRCIWD